MADFGRRKGEDALLVALAGGRTVREAARAAGIGERTARRRLAEPGFARRVAALQAQMIEQALGRSVKSMSAAADTLRKLLRAQSESVRLGAARALLELPVKLRDSVELEQRLAALEERLAAKERKP
jgi:hypothetical protein